jgi:magnesium transporter
VENTLGIEVPTRQEMQEIEASSRLYREADAWYMTATVIVMADTPHPEGSAVTFILVNHRLVTLRYAEPRAFRSFAAHSERQPSFCTTGEVAFVGLLEAIVDRTADILEQVSSDMDLLSQRIFTYDPSCRPATLSGNDFQEMLCRIGRNQYLIAKARESLVSLSRLLSFLALPGDVKHSEDLRPRVKTLSRDVSSLTDHTAYISGNVTFLLDALLGMINIQQNGIIKIFSVAAVVFLPPTLVASIYGMNFEFMPELDWPLGYPFAILIMIVSAILPYLYFKRRGWL